MSRASSQSVGGGEDTWKGDFTTLCGSDVQRKIDTDWKWCGGSSVMSTGSKCNYNSFNGSCKVCQEYFWFTLF